MPREPISLIKMVSVLPWPQINFPLTAVGGVINIYEETLHAVNASAEFSVKLAPDEAEPWQDSKQTLRYHLGMASSKSARLENDTDEEADHCVDNLRQKVDVSRRRCQERKKRS